MKPSLALLTQHNLIWSQCSIEGKLKIPRVDVEVYTVVVEDFVMVVQYTMNLKKLTNPCCQLPLSLQDSEEYFVTFHPDFRCPPAPLSRSHHLPLLPELAPP